MSESDQTLKEKPFRNMVFTTTGLNQRKEINEVSNLPQILIVFTNHVFIEPICSTH